MTGWGPGEIWGPKTSMSDPKSPSYLKAMRAAHHWLLNTKDGKYATEFLRQNSPNQDLAAVIENGGWINWEDMVSENRDNLLLASNCYEAREAVKLSRQSKGLMGAPTTSQSKLMRFASFPLWYVLRRQVETADPDYWSSPVNVMRECLKHPQFTTVPAEIIRGQLERLLPKPTEVIVAGQRRSSSSDGPPAVGTRTMDDMSESGV